MKFFILHIFVLVPIFCFAQFNTTSFATIDAIDFDIELFPKGSISKAFMNQPLLLMDDEVKPTMYLLGELDADRHYTSYSSFGASFFSSMLFPPAGLITSTILSFAPPKEINFGLPEDKLALLKDEYYYDGYAKASRKKKIWRSWGGFVTGTAFFYAGFRMVGYNLEDYLFK